MISLEDKKRQLLLSDKEIKMACNSLWIKPNEHNEISIEDAKRLNDWAEGYKEASAIAGGKVL